jgi:ribonuclease VapC
MRISVADAKPVERAEPDGLAWMVIIEASSPILISVATAVEAMIVATRQGFATQMAGMIRSTVSQIIPVTPERVEHMIAAYTRCGKGIHLRGRQFR